jgi:hypothetical protein
MPLIWGAPCRLFLSNIGKTDDAQTFDYWRDQPRGYILAGLVLDGQRGVPLPHGM